MKITFSSPGRRGFGIRLPLWIFSMFLNKTVFRMALMSMPEEVRAWIGEIDTRALRKAMAELKSYDGLEILRVDGADGSHVRIVV